MVGTGGALLGAILVIIGMYFCGRVYYCFKTQGTREFPLRRIWAGDWKVQTVHLRRLQIAAAAKVAEGEYGYSQERARDQERAEELLASYEMWRRRFKAFQARAQSLHCACCATAHRSKPCRHMSCG